MNKLSPSFCPRLAVTRRRDPKPAVPAEIDEEERSIGSVFNGTCPVRAVVERVSITPGGVFMVCWNVLSGGEPAMIRRVRLLFVTPLLEPSCTACCRLLAKACCRPGEDSCFCKAPLMTLR